MSSYIYGYEMGKGLVVGKDIMKQTEPAERIRELTILNVGCTHDMESEYNIAVALENGAGTVESHGRTYDMYKFELENGAGIIKNNGRTYNMYKFEIRESIILEEHTGTLVSSVLPRFLYLNARDKDRYRIDCLDLRHSVYKEVCIVCENGNSVFDIDCVLATSFAELNIKSYSMYEYTPSVSIDMETLYGLGRFKSEYNVEVHIKELDNSCVLTERPENEIKITALGIQCSRFDIMQIATYVEWFCTGSVSLNADTLYNLEKFLSGYDEPSDVLDDLYIKSSTLADTIIDYFKMKEYDGNIQGKPVITWDDLGRSETVCMSGGGYVLHGSIDDGYTAYGLYRKE